MEMLIRFLIVAALFLLPAPSFSPTFFAQAAVDPSCHWARTGDARIEPPARSAAIGRELEGTWNGTVNANGVHRTLVLTVANDGDGATASIMNVDEGLEIPVTAINQKASTVTLDVRAVGA